jgi:hypothetical protein
MKPQMGYTPVQSVHPFAGMNTTNASTLLNPSVSPSLKNVTVVDGNLKKRKGYKLLGNLSTGGLQIMELISFQDGSGNTHLVAVSTARCYVYEYTTNTWTDITGLAALTGDETNLISYVSATGTDTGRVLLITNGKDKPRFWAGNHGVPFADVNFNLPSFVTCQCFAYMNDTLIMGNVTTSSAAPQTVVWANAGQVLEWLAGTSGAETIYDALGAIVAMVPLSNSMVIYAKDSIHVMTFVGGAAVYTIQKVVENTRLASARAIVNLGPYHLFMGQENIQMFDGSTVSVTVGDEIHESYRNSLANNLLHRAYVSLDRSRKNVYFNVPVNQTSGGYRMDVYVLNYDLKSFQNWRWVLHNYGNTITSMGFYVRENSLTWGDATIAGVTWAEMSGVWGTSSGTKGFPSRVLGTSSGSVMLADESSPDDNGVTIDSSWDSIDFTLPQEYQSEIARFLELELELTGGSVDVYYSTDRGVSYSLAQTVSLSAGWGFYRVPVDGIGRTVRVRVREASPTGYWEMRFLRAWFTPAGPY